MLGPHMFSLFELTIRYKKNFNFAFEQESHNSDKDPYTRYYKL